MIEPGRDADGAATQAIIDGVTRSSVVRLLVVGGGRHAGSGTGQAAGRPARLPHAVEGGGTVHGRFLDQLRAEAKLDWVFFSPAANLAPGERTGRYRAGGASS